MTARPYLRFPDIRGDALAFVTDDDVWIGSVERGEAWRLGIGPTIVRNPRLSQDGATVAWASNASGSMDIWMAPLAGGEVRRLTWWGDNGTTLLGWLNDGRVLAASSHDAWHRRDCWAWAVPVDGGPAQRLDLGPLSGLSESGTGRRVLGVDQSLSRGFAWKRYRGGTAAKIWIEEDAEFRRFLPELDGQLEDPQWWSERVVFLSDHEGWGNVYSVLPDGSGLRRHSDHGNAYARSARTDGERLVYSCAGDLWILDSLAADSQPRLLEVSLTSARRGRARYPLDAAGAVRRIEPDHTGRASAAVVRGAAVWLTHRDGPARVLAPGGAVRAKLAAPLGKDHVVWVSDAGGTDGLEVVPVTGGESRRLAAGELWVVDDLAASPDGAWVATAGADGAVRLTNIGSGETREIDRSLHDAAQHLSWSPDATWLAWSHAGASDPDSVGHLRQIRLFEVATSTVVEATPVRFADTEPVWTPDGLYLAFLSRRVFDPVYDQVRFDLGFPAATRPYLLRLGAGSPIPLSPEPAGRPVGEDDTGTAQGAHGPAQSAHGPVTVVVDTDGLADRLVEVPVAAGRLSRLLATKRGLVWLEHISTGELGEGRVDPEEHPKAKLVHLDVRKGKVDTLVEAVDEAAVSGDGELLVVRCDGSVKVLPADRKAAEDGHDTVEVDLGRILLTVDPAAEWPQMFEEAARLQRHLYWVEDMGGLNWDAVVARYRPLADRVSTRDELTDLLWELHGELGTSHAYAMAPEAPTPPRQRQGYLGVDLTADGGEWRIGAIPTSEPSVRRARSPLGAAGAQVGDVIEIVDGRAVDAGTGPAPLLVGAADRIVEIGLRGEDGSARAVAVKALPDERELRYHAWVAANRSLVHQAAEGRLGYLHVPNMMSLGWAELQRDLRLESGRDGLIVDLRHNGGGHTSELVLERLSSRVTAWDKPRGFEPSRYPLDGPRGPMVALIDQAAGSDGDIAAAGFRQRGLGPLVGTRTWGGVVGIDGRYDLADGGFVTQPRYAFWFDGGVGWSVEGHGVDPDVEVAFGPHDFAAGRDPQLDAAIATVLAALEQQRPAQPPSLDDRPPRDQPVLPPRTEAF
ncbi:MAG: S41 family peptidase [Acidimicrobiales bacterium]